MTFQPKCAECGTRKPTVCDKCHDELQQRIEELETRIAELEYQREIRPDYQRGLFPEE